MRNSFLNIDDLDNENKKFIKNAIKNNNILKNLLDSDTLYDIHDFESDFETFSNIIFSAGMKCRYYKDKLLYKNKSDKPFLVPILSSNAFDINEKKDIEKNIFKTEITFLKKNNNLYRCGILLMPPNSKIIKTQGSFNPYMFIYNLNESTIKIECNDCEEKQITKDNYCIADYNSKVFKISNLSNTLSYSFVSLLKTSANSKPNLFASNINIYN